MGKIIKFGEQVSGFSIPVLNEREIRASAGIYFLLLSAAVQTVIYNGNFLPLKIFITIFLLDFSLRVFVNPKFSPTLIISRFIVGNQVPEYVGAAQKKFAWIIGIIFASIMFFLLVVINRYSPISGIICFLCLIFLFFESVFGICLGCIFYSFIRKEENQYCPGEVCDPKSKHQIQKTSPAQLFVVLGFAVFVTIIVYFFYDIYGLVPVKLF